jgi:hypothetical protein
VIRPKVSEKLLPNDGGRKLRYKFFTPYSRGFDLVWDFLCKQPNGEYSDGTLTIKGKYGYERARDLNGLDLSDYDLKPLRKLFNEMQRRDRRAKAREAIHA